jgi:hypothetical protein
MRHLLRFGAAPQDDPAFLNAFLADPMSEIRNSGILLDMTPPIDIKWPSARRTSAHSKA